VGGSSDSGPAADPDSEYLSNKKNHLAAELHSFNPTLNFLSQTFFS
jgi:hypothetical protein